MGTEKMQNTKAGQARHAVSRHATLAKLSLFGEAKERRWASTHANWQKDFRRHSLATGRSESIGCSECKCGDCEGTECEGGNARA